MKYILIIINGIVGIFTDNKKSISCKKLIGVIAWMYVLEGWTYCCRHNLQLPDCTDMIIATASALIGFNTFKGIMSLFAKGGGEK